MILIEEEDYISHFGVMGMRWGVRKDDHPGVDHKTNKIARKDAEEFARARAFFGQGAGTRRKLIKQTVEGKSKRIPGYKEAFNHHLNNQDTSTHAKKAVSERTRTDRKGRFKQRAGYFARRITHEPGTQAAFAAAAVGGATYLNSSSGRQKLRQASSFAKKTYNKQVMVNGAVKVQKLLKIIK